MIMTFVQSVLRSLGIYERIKHSFVYSTYWKVFGYGYIEERRGQCNFYEKLLSGQSGRKLIIDVGANQGAKTAIFLDLGFEVIAIDPDPVNQAILERSFRRWRLKPKQVQIVGKALADRVGTARLLVSDLGSAMNTLNAKWAAICSDDSRRFGRKLSFSNSVSVETTTLENIIEEFGLPCFVKIDVEGFELQVLQGLLRPVPCLSFEVNLPEFLDEGLKCVEYLGVLSPRGCFNVSADCCEGMMLPAWVDAKSFAGELRAVVAPSVEVFWLSEGKQPLSSGNSE